MDNADTFQGQGLIFLVSMPRSGSTLLQRMLASHSEVTTHPEPHILTPLLHVGYYRRVNKAGYNIKAASKGLVDFVDSLPAGEADYRDACRAYAGTLYTRMRATAPGARWFVDKTPDYARSVLPLIPELFPQARIVVLARHPVAVLASIARTFRHGDMDRALLTRNVPGEFVPSLAHCLRTWPSQTHRVCYESLVREPEEVLRALCAFIGLSYEAGMARYGAQSHTDKRLGDPHVHRHDRPVTDSLALWEQDLRRSRRRRVVAARVVRALPEEDLETLGYARATMLGRIEALGREKTVERNSDDRWWRTLGWELWWRLRRGVQRGGMLRHGLVALRERLDALLDYRYRF